MKRTMLAVTLAAPALSGCITAEQLMAQCRDRAVLVGAPQTQEWLNACTRELARRYNAEFSNNVVQGYNMTRPRTCTSTGSVTTCY